MNTLTKTAMTMVSGAPELKRRLLPFALLLLGAGVGAAFLAG